MGTNEKGECVEKIDKKDKIGMFYCISFQLRINLTVNCVINLSKSGSESSSIIQLTAVSFNKRRTQWKEINSNEISMRQNTKIIKMFETEILDKLGKWEHA